MTEQSIDELLRLAKAAANQGNTEQARKLLSNIVQHDPNHEQAWLWLSGVVDSADKMRYCLDRVLAINPTNQLALSALEDFAELAEQRFRNQTKPLGTPTQPIPSQTEPLETPATPKQPTKPRPRARNVAMPRPRPESMIESGAVQDVLQGHQRTTWGYIGLWSGLVAVHMLLLRAPNLAQQSLVQAIGVVLQLGLIIAIIQLPAWWLLLNNQSRIQHETLGRTTYLALLSAMLWRSSLLLIAGIGVGLLGVWWGDPWLAVLRLAQLLIVAWSVFNLMTQLLRPAIPGLELDRMTSAKMTQASLIWFCFWAASLVAAWIW
ncbi:MAG: tetratricopeptide repeat protein [Chloroflexi bacterium]|nr:tetratricopeptide repeat protein [Chloroflexota bacterium]